MEKSENPFDSFEVISTYRDEQAVDDGLLVPVTKKDRVHRSVWEAFCTRAPKGAKPPNCWPVDLMGWFTSTKVSPTEALQLIAKYGATEGQQKLNQIITDRKVRAMSLGIIRTYDKQARKVFDENIGGGILALYAELEGTDFDGAGILASLSAEERGVPALRLWLIPNDAGGVTLLFPEDY